MRTFGMGCTENSFSLVIFVRTALFAVSASHVKFHSGHSHRLSLLSGSLMRVDWFHRGSMAVMVLPSLLTLIHMRELVTFHRLHVR
ncbi:hypothetical protein BJ912DRAFT_995820 [Pholiota molesta]|nr:hypothetical protein BJ912DRAFT_995820 [Pholiota molesta]